METDVRPERMGMQLAVSRDGLQWTRVADRFVFLGQQQDPEAWDQAAPTDWVRPATGLHTVDGEVRFYYNAGPLADGCYGIGMARWRRDGFVSITSDAEGGELLTGAFVADGSKLHLNVDAGSGEVRVKLCNLQGQPFEERKWHLAGLPPSEWSDPIRGDHLDSVVEWADGGDMSMLRGRPVALRIRLRGTRLYSFWTA